MSADQSRHSPVVQSALGYMEQLSSFDVPSSLSLKLMLLLLLQLQPSGAGGSLNQIRTLDSDMDSDLSWGEFLASSALGSLSCQPYENCQNSRSCLPPGSLPQLKTRPDDCLYLYHYQCRCRCRCHCRRRILNQRRRVLCAMFQMTRPENRPGDLGRATSSTHNSDTLHGFNSGLFLCRDSGRTPSIMFVYK
ncbi:GL10364 [Drosophila persimilis]|uniref:GL10364 n=1 Tax=Drosophila persimilis TaxID=7234 RepID=B4GD87_DROPE|nr:GL10364 [Drosophila persimilis]